jgi:hypothetical protein
MQLTAAHLFELSNAALSFGALAAGAWHLQPSPVAIGTHIERHLRAFAALMRQRVEIVVRVEAIIRA